MRSEKKQLRHEAITQAAYALLAEGGYDGTSMLAIAKAAKASNETLYRWYGDKRGLFQTMVADNAAEVAQKLRLAIDEQQDPMKALRRVAPVFLAMLLGDRAVSLNRAAAADPTGTLGKAISESGKEAVQPLFAQLMMPLAGNDKAKAQHLTGMFLGLLVGDLQVRRVIGVSQAPAQADIEIRIGLAFEAFEKLLPRQGPV